MLDDFARVSQPQTDQADYDGAPPGLGCILPDPQSVERVGGIVLVEGVGLMVVGMTTVFAFLSVLVLAMHANRMLADALGGRPTPPTTPAPSHADNDVAIAVVLAAIAARRGERA